MMHRLAWQWLQWPSVRVYAGLQSEYRWVIVRNGKYYVEPAMELLANGQIKNHYQRWEKPPWLPSSFFKFPQKNVLVVKKPLAGITVYDGYSM